MFVLLKGRSLKEAFQIGHEIASEVSAMSPNPVTLKMENVYHPCFLITKKRYVGYSYESPDQSKPIFDAKGIETVRRDSCGAVCKTMERSLRLFFEHHDIEKVLHVTFRFIKVFEMLTFEFKISTCIQSYLPKICSLTCTNFDIFDIQELMLC